MTTDASMRSYVSDTGFLYGIYKGYKGGTARLMHSPFGKNRDG